MVESCCDIMTIVMTTQNVIFLSSKNNCCASSFSWAFHRSVVEIETSKEGAMEKFLKNPNGDVLDLTNDSDGEKAAGQKVIFFY